MLETILIIYLLIAYSITGYAIYTTMRDSKPLDLFLFMMSPILFPILIVITIKFWFDNKNEILEEHDKQDNPWNNNNPV